MRALVVASIFLLLVQSPLILASRNDTQRIIGGREVRPGQFPFQVALYIDTPDGRYFGAGCLIGTKHILTNARNIYQASSITLQFGSVTLTTEDPNRVIAATVNKIIHPEFDPATFAHDIGIIVLHIPLVLNNYIQPIHLPTREIIPEDELLTLGWGLTSDTAVYQPEILNYVFLVAITNQECGIFYPAAQVTDEMVCCSGNYNEGICSGDIGGPLVQLDQGGLGILAGVSSFWSSEGCESIGPSGFTRIWSYVDWIRQVLNST